MRRAAAAAVTDVWGEGGQEGGENVRVAVMDGAWSGRRGRSRLRRVQQVRMVGAVASLLPLGSVSPRAKPADAVQRAPSGSECRAPCLAGRASAASSNTRSNRRCWMPVGDTADATVAATNSPILLFKKEKTTRIRKM